MTIEYSPTHSVGAPWRRQLAALVLASSALLSFPVWAEPASDDATRSAARALGYEGLDAYKAGDYPKAEEKLAKAFAAVKVPTLALWLGRTLAKRGKLVEASERYAEAARLTVSEGEIAAQKGAQREASEELEALEPRLPRVRIMIEGAKPQEVRVSVDGVEVPTALIGAKRPINPGRRTISGRLGPKVVKQQISITEGQTQTVVLHFRQSSPAETELAAADSETATEGHRKSRGEVQRVASWIALGVGAVGALAGTATGLAALVKKNAVSNDCPKNSCPPSRHDDADTVNSLRHVSTAGFIVGGIGVGTGLALLLTLPSGSEVPRKAARLEPWIGAGSAGIGGRF